MSSQPPQNHLPSPNRFPAWLSGLWSVTQFLLALALTVGFLLYLLLSPAHSDDQEQDKGPKRPQEVVELIEPLKLRLIPGTYLEKRLETVTVRSANLQTPLFRVTGTVLASRRPGKEGRPDFWQFDSPELLTTVADWEKTIEEIDFAQTQLISIRELADQRVKSQQEVVARMKRLVAAGTDTIRDLRNEENNLLQFQIQGRKEVHEAETAVRVARRNEAALVRQIQQASLDPELLKNATPDMDIVVGEVPESRASEVRKGQGCEARFFGLADVNFTGKVTSIAPVLSRERRTLRVLFLIYDPKDLLRPGMFADVGLGTDPHAVIRIPAEAALHVGRADYVLVELENRLWQIREVKIGEMEQNEVEILSGVTPGERVLGKGAILLKPFVVRALRAAGVVK